MTESSGEKVARFQAALDEFIERLRQDRYILAAVLVGSLNEATIWRRESMFLWVIEDDGVTKRLSSDGNDERLFRTLCEDGINIHAELIPRTRFRQMVEGSSRTAFSCSFFAERKLVYCDEPSIATWFEQANQAATKDQERELLATMTWAIYAHRSADKTLRIKGDLGLAQQDVLCAAHALAAIEIIRAGQVYEEEAIYKALEINPDLFQTIYVDIIGSKKKKALESAVDAINEYLEQHANTFLKPLLQYLKRQQRMVPLTELSEQFAFTQLYPWHLEAACEWLERKGRLEKLSTPFKLTKKSREEVEEPAYFFDPT